jgi:hypothetical protein
MLMSCILHERSRIRTFMASLCTTGFNASCFALIVLAEYVRILFVRLLFCCIVGIVMKCLFLFIFDFFLLVWVFGSLRHFRYESRCIDLFDLHWVRALADRLIDGPFEVDVLVFSVCNLSFLVPQLKCCLHIWYLMRAVCSVHHSPLYIIIHITKKTLKLQYISRAVPTPQ